MMHPYSLAFYAFHAAQEEEEEENNNSLTGSDVTLTRAWASARYLVSGFWCWIVHYPLTGGGLVEQGARLDFYHRHPNSENNHRRA